MKIKVCAKSLTDVLTAVKGAMDDINTKGYSPLNNVKITANEGNIYVTKSGGNKEYIATMKNEEVIEDGMIIVDYKTILELAKKMKFEIMTIEDSFADSIVAMTIGGANFKIKNNIEEYPQSLSFDPNSKVIKVRQNDFKRLIHNTVFAVSTDDSRPVLNGCYIACEYKGIEMVAIDGFRMAINRADLLEGIETKIMLNIPGKDLKEIEKLLSSKGNVEIQKVSDKNVVLQFENNKKVDMTIILRLIEGEYMGYKKIVPSTAETIIELKLEDFKTLFEFGFQGDMNYKKNTNPFPLQIKAEGQDITFGCSNQMGKFSQTLQCINKIGKDIDINFNPRYFNDILNCIESKEVRIRMNGNMSAATIEPNNSSEFLYLVLPLRR